MKMKTSMKIGLGIVIVGAFFMFLASAMQSGLCLGLAFVAMGLGIFLCTITSETAILTKMLPIYLCVDFWFMGCIMIAIELINEYTVLYINDEIMIYVIGMGIGSLMVFIGIFMCSKVFLCKEPVQARCIGLKFSGKQGFTPEFEFEYKNRMYRNGSGECYSHRRASRRYKEQEMYTIYINPKDPYIFRSRRGIPGSGIFVTLLGILFCVIPFAS